MLPEAAFRARNLDQFKSALQLIDFASQNLIYADKKGNIGYFVTVADCFT